MPDYENRVRIRCCGLLVENEKVLLVELLSPITKKLIWTPPGGGIKFRETREETVEREFFEETGLKVQVGNLLHINELIREKFHVIEFYYRVDLCSGKLEMGTDPEYSNEEQIIQKVEFKAKEELQKLDVVPTYLKSKFWEDYNQDT